MAISPDLTFDYCLSVQSLQLHRPADLDWARSLGLDPSFEGDCWAGSGTGQASFGRSEGLAGPRPSFQLFCGWLTLLTTEQWEHWFPLLAFSDAGPESPLEERTRQFIADRKEALELAKQMGKSDLENVRQARKLVERRNERIRNLSSYSLFVGEALEQLLQEHDEIYFLRDGNGDFRYSVRRQAETLFAVGSPAGRDGGGTVSIWQQHDEYPNPTAQQFRQQMKDLPVVETFKFHRPYINARVQNQLFLLLDDDEVEVDPYYLYLARSNQKVPP